ncbi:LysR family transcriptional regulator [Glaciimonas sp. PCH181]|uniref:LysR family transcriptional regulator n=1 Tax=Glaciimonas sp. PCH181 TaxID=2133943 RepID=UPI000D3A94D5|nr:LysR family transcriptional regulator [Glaciimonas sp. PCH181]PUA19121.1 LysR family transcriptional regulator [Glaciimonas sp. PCH181]
MRDLDLTTLRLFVAVCATGNMARAGEQENIVASAISKRLAVLEDTVGVKLLERRRHGMAPTAAGETLLEHARGMLAGADRVMRDMAGYSVGVKGQVRILATVSSMAESLPDDVAAFLQQPSSQGIRVDVEERFSKDVVKGLKEGSASVGICWDAADMDSLQSRPYRSDHLAIVVYPSHALAGRKHVSFEETLEFDHVGLPSSSAVQIMLTQAAAIAGKVLNYRAIVSTFDAALKVVHAQLGISIVPREIAQTFATSFDLRVIPLNDPWAQRRFAICFRDIAALSPAARLLVDYLAARAIATTPEEQITVP